MVQKLMTYAKDYVSCIHCAACYSAADETKPIWCQVYSFIVYSNEVKENEERAEACKSWVPRGTDRSKTITPDVERYYEKDSLG